VAIKTNTFENIIAEDNEEKIKIYPTEKNQIYLNFFKNEIDMSKEKERVMFIKQTEDIIRISDEYAGYIAHLKEDIPEQNHCAFHSLIFDTEKVKIQMHHGPIFTLFDIVEIVLLYFIKNKKDISTFQIAEQVLRDHHAHLINTVALCDNCHITAHNYKPNIKKPFITLEHSFGDFTSFLKKYSDALTYQHINKIRYYFHNESQYKKSDFNNTVLKEKITVFGQGVAL